MDNPARRVLERTIIAVVAVMVAITVCGSLQLWKWQETDSLPKGLYLRSFAPVQRGSIVFFRLPTIMRNYIWQRSPAWLAYFDNGRGLIKPVAAVAGDTICRDGPTFRINGEPAAVVLPDSELPAWQGCVTLSPEWIAVLSTRIVDSLDSRYFGPIRLADVKSYIPLWTMDR